MQRLTIVLKTPRGLAAMAATVLLGAVVAYAADPDPALAGWIGREMTISSSSFSDHVPRGGKLTFVLDSQDNVVRICTRNVQGQQGSWRNDMAPGCNVALTFTRGTRYCTNEDVLAGNAEVLSTCHRLRSHDVAMHPAAVKGALELHDVIVFLVQGDGGKHAISILVDSPSRVTAGGTAIGQE
jgi:hypothetical protein